MKKTLGGDRLGSGSKMQVELHNYERSTHDLSYLWRSTMSPGTLVPFMSEIALPGDTFDIVLNCNVLTHPTVAPLFGSFKVQLDVFQAPIRLYNALLHNNHLGIGNKMSQVKFPVIEMTALQNGLPKDLDNSQINPSSLLKYLGLSGIGLVISPQISHVRTFNAIPILAYWEIYKNYYANKQEEIGAVIHTPTAAIVQTVTDIAVNGQVVQHNPGTVAAVPMPLAALIQVMYSGTTPILSQLYIYTTGHGLVSLDNIATGWVDNGSGVWNGYLLDEFENDTAEYWEYQSAATAGTGKPAVATFPLSYLDDMRQAILSNPSTTTAYKINNLNKEPYKWLYEQPNGIPNILSNQEGLALKTYQSDLFNNWLSTEWIDGTNGINEITAIDTSGGSFTIDTLNLSKKIYDMLNRIAVSGGSYNDWLDAVYTHDRYTMAESPIYCGGLIKELVFQEVVSNTQSGDQPLGTLAGKGVMSHKHKGGTVVIKVDEPSYIIGIISLTPRVDYSQGNKWDLHLQTMDDLHKPALDEIGFQELITEQMAWWDTHYDTLSGWVQKSAGKQPAWINYMTNVNQIRGNFAIQNNEMFMTLNRRYEVDPTAGTTFGQIKDLTTYIDPSKYNTIFAQTSLDAQNFWSQIAVNITLRRKISAKVMPNL